MKRKWMILPLLVALALLSSCANTPAQPQSAQSQAASSAAPQPISSAAPSSEESAASGGEIGIDIEYVSHDGALSVPATTYRHGNYSFELPEDWTVVDGTDMGLMNGLFLVPPGTDMENLRFSAHVALELFDEPPYPPDQVPNFEQPDIQESFFAYQIARQYSKMGGLENLEFQVWDSDNGYVYIEQFERVSDAAHMYQTTYHLMHPERDLVLYASQFGEDASPSVNEVARHLAATFQPA